MWSRCTVKSAKRGAAETSCGVRKRKLALFLGGSRSFRS